MDGSLSGWWLLKQNQCNRDECREWWWAYVVSLLIRIDNVGKMAWMHPDRDLPPMSDWLDNKRLDEWEKQCEQLRKAKQQEGW